MFRHKILLFSFENGSSLHVTFSLFCKSHFVVFSLSQFLFLKEIQRENLLIFSCFIFIDSKGNLTLMYQVICSMVPAADSQHTRRATLWVPDTRRVNCVRAPCREHGASDHCAPTRVPKEEIPAELWSGT